MRKPYLIASLSFGLRKDSGKGYVSFVSDKAAMDSDDPLPLRGSATELEILNSPKNSVEGKTFLAVKAETRQVTSGRGSTEFLALCNVKVADYSRDEIAEIFKKLEKRFQDRTQLASGKKGNATDTVVFSQILADWLAEDEYLPASPAPAAKFKAESKRVSPAENRPASHPVGNIGESLLLLAFNAAVIVILVTCGIMALASGEKHAPTSTNTDPNHNDTPSVTNPQSMQTIATKTVPPTDPDTGQTPIKNLDSVQPVPPVPPPPIALFEKALQELPPLDKFKERCEKIADLASEIKNGRLKVVSKPNALKRLCEELDKIQSACQADLVKAADDVAKVLNSLIEDSFDIATFERQFRDAIDACDKEIVKANLLADDLNRINQDLNPNTKAVWDPKSDALVAQKLFEAIGSKYRKVLVKPEDAMSEFFTLSRLYIDPNLIVNVSRLSSKCEELLKRFSEIDACVQQASVKFGKITIGDGVASGVIEFRMMGVKIKQFDLPLEKTEGLGLSIPPFDVPIKMILIVNGMKSDSKDISIYGKKEEDNKNEKNVQIKVALNDEQSKTKVEFVIDYDKLSMKDAFIEAHNLCKGFLTKPLK